MKTPTTKQTPTAPIANRKDGKCRNYCLEAGVACRCGEPQEPMRPACLRCHVRESMHGRTVCEECAS
jgi:hypothetical protein